MSDMLFFGILFQGPSPASGTSRKLLLLSRQCVLSNVVKKQNKKKNTVSIISTGVGNFLMNASKKRKKKEKNKKTQGIQDVVYRQSHSMWLIFYSQFQDFAKAKSSLLEYNFLQQ